MATALGFAAFLGALHSLAPGHGKTVIGDQQIESVANQLVIFENVPHYGTVQTDTDTRVVINFNLRLA